MTDGNNPGDRRGPEGTLKIPSEPPPPPKRGGGGSAPTSQRGIQVPDSWDARQSAQSARIEVPGVQQAQAPEERDSPSKAMIILGILTVIAVTAAAGFVAWELTNPSDTPTTPTSSAPGVSAAPSPSACTSCDGPSPASSTSAAPSASASGASPGACFRDLLPAGAFTQKPPDLAACCSEQPAYPTMLKLKSAVVASGGGNTTAAMREWSKLGWYELAAFAMMRSHCCTGAPALTAPSETKACNLEAALAALGGALDDGKAMEKALRDYRTAVDCLVDKGHSSLFGRNGPPQGGELQYIEQLLGRVRRARSESKR